MILAAPALCFLMATTQTPAQDVPSRLAQDARDFRDQIVLVFTKVGQTFKTMGQDVGQGAKTAGLAVGHEAQHVGRKVGEGTVTVSAKVKKRLKKIGQGAKEAVN